MRPFIQLIKSLFQEKKAPPPKTQKKKPFLGSEKYWEERYASGGNSGVGSYGKFAEFKASILNEFVQKNNIQSVIEFGCGDGNQASLSHYPTYIGFDISQTAITTCNERFSQDTTKKFFLINEYQNQKADLTLSLDVIFHLVEDSVFQEYMNRLIHASNKYVIIYSSDSDENPHAEVLHVKHRKITRWMKENYPNWKLIEHIPNKYPYQGDYKEGSFADFFVYEKVS